MIKIDGFDDAIIGVTDTWLPDTKLVYDGQKIIELLPRPFKWGLRPVDVAVDPPDSLLKLVVVPLLESGTLGFCLLL